MTSIIQQGYWLRPSPVLHAGPSHRLGGATRDPRATCPNCQKPLLTLWELDARDPILRLGDAGPASLTVLFCWTCPAAQSNIIYQLPRTGVGFRLLEFAVGEPSADFPYEDYPEAFPPRALSLVALSEEEQAVLRELNGDGEVDWSKGLYRELSCPRHQVGGEPFLVQPLEDLDCPHCGDRMPLFGTVGNDTFGPKKFTDNDYVQTLVHLCHRCWTVAVYQRCD